MDSAETSEDEAGKGEGQLSNCTIAWRLRYMLALLAITLVQYCSVGPSVVYVQQSFFAGDGADCEADPSSDVCKKGSAELAYWSGLSKGASHSVAWLFALSMGSWSDRIGRRPLFRAKSILSVLPTIFLGMHMTTGFSLWAYLIASPIYDAFDTNGVFLAFMSDVIVEPHSRASAFGVVAVFCFVVVGLVLPVAAFLPAGVAVAISVVSAVLKLAFIYSVFPETVHADKVQPMRRPPNVLDVARQSIRVFCRHSFIARMALVLILSGLALAGLFTVVTPVLTGYMGMKKSAFTGLFAAAGISIVASMVGIMPRLVRSIGEVRALQLCLALGAVFVALFPLCQTPVHVTVLCFVLAGPMTLQFPIISAIKSNLVNQDEQGLVQGALAAVRVIATAVADIFFGWFYKFATDGGMAPRSSTLWPLGTVFVLSVVAGLLALSLPKTPPPPPPQGGAAAGGAEAATVGDVEAPHVRRHGAPVAAAEVEMTIAGTAA